MPEELEDAREGPRRHLLRQLLGLPVGARPLGGEAAVPDHADPPARREADAARRLRRPHLRQRRQDRPVHRPARREGRARAAPLERRSPTTSACSWSAPTRRSWATCTTCSATPTPCTCGSTTRAATRSSTWSRATRSTRCSPTCSTTAARWSRRCAARPRRRCARRDHARGERAAAEALRAGPAGVHVPLARRVAARGGAARHARSPRACDRPGT